VASRYYTYGMGHHGHRYSRGGCSYCSATCSHPLGFSGTCEECYKKYKGNDAAGCQTGYQPQKSANRDDIMATGFIPSDFKGPIKVRIIKLSGYDFAPEMACPPEHYTGQCEELAKLTPKVEKCEDFANYVTCEDLKAVENCTSFGALSTCTELQKLTSSEECPFKLWMPPEQDIFLTFTKVDEIPEDGGGGGGTTPRGEKKEKDETGKSWLWVLGCGFLGCCACVCCSIMCGPAQQNNARTVYASESEMRAYEQPAPSYGYGFGQQPSAPQAHAVASGYGTAAQATMMAPQAQPAAWPPTASPPTSAVRVCCRGHRLDGFKHSLGQPGECDRCEGRISYGEFAYGCRACDFDLCQACINLDTFLDFPAYRGTYTWRQELLQATPLQTQEGLLAPPWSDAMLHAVAWELNNPHWPDDERFRGARNGPAGQIIDFMCGIGFEWLRPIADNTEQWAKDATGLSEIQRMHQAGYQPQDHQLPCDPITLRRMLGHSGLKQELQTRGLKDTGKTDDLAVRLCEALQKERQ